VNTRRKPTLRIVCRIARVVGCCDDLPVPVIPTRRWRRSLQLADMSTIWGTMKALIRFPLPTDRAFAYGSRLRELKHKYDPKNFFRINQNIRPSA
jgi:hypothetical protein